MAYSAATFTIAQSALAPNLVVATDTHTGTDAAVTQRRIYVANAFGEYLVPSGTTTDYTAWALVDTSISLNILSSDTATSITVQWLNVSNVVLYTTTEEFCLAEYGKQFFFYLFQQQSLMPGIVQDANYYNNLCQFWANVRGAITAVETGDDIASSQNALNRETLMQNNQTSYF